MAELSTHELDEVSAGVAPIILAAHIISVGGGIAGIAAWILE
ncbi:hypothetical protein [Alteromonas oceanisediminis]|nr:hypothetical protein [Alteromonas oceanisediminis]